MLISDLEKKKAISPPKWLADNTSYLTIMGSVAYGVNTDTSDFDLYGFCIPPKTLTFPHLAGEIPGFGTQIKRFDQWQEHHVDDPDGRDRTYDFSVYSIVKYFQLCMENNPNMIDSLFTPSRCVMHSTRIAELVRDNRTMFLHKGAFHKFRGYAYSQRSKIKNKTNSSNPKRAETIEQFGYDVKFAYHLVRLASECQQILETGDLNLEKDREMLKSIRRGEWTLEDVDNWFVAKEKHLEDLENKSQLPNKPREDEIRQLLLKCLEEHYGSLDKAVSMDNSSQALINELERVIEKYR